MCMDKGETSLLEFETSVALSDAAIVTKLAEVLNVQ